MSFILDALKKSETERQRGDAPALYEAKMAPPRRAVAPWLLVLAALLVINIVVLTVVLLRGTHGAAPALDTAAPAPVAAAVATPPVPAVPMTAPPVANPAPQPAPAATPPVPPAAPAAAAAEAAGTAMTDPPVGGPGTGAARQSDDDAPAVEPPRAARGSGGSGSNGMVQATGGGSGELPTYQQAAAAPGANLPDLTLNLHAYATNPADRFIFLNMIRLTEGQTSPQGVRVEAITPDGAVLSWQGSRFLLQRQ